MDAHGNSTAPGVPNLPTNMHYEGPWLQQQIILSLGVGLVSLLVFGLWKRRYPSFYFGRHRRYGSPLRDQRVKRDLLGWVWPTLMVPQRDVLKAVGLDAAASLLFLQMGFLYFAFASLWAMVVLMPVNYFHNGWIDGVTRPGSRHNKEKEPLATNALASKPHGPLPFLPTPSMSVRESLYANTQLVSTYVYTLLGLYMLWTSYMVFVQYRQGSAPREVHTERTRTVEVRALPPHLADEDALAAYFNEMKLYVEHIVILKKTGRLDAILKERLNVLLELELVWSTFIGDPRRAENYDPEAIRRETHEMHVPPLPGVRPVIGADVKGVRPRPTTRTTWWNPFSARVDKIDELSYKFATLDAETREMRQSSFPHGRTAFVTFKEAISAVRNRSVRR